MPAPDSTVHVDREGGVCTWTTTDGNVAVGDPDGKWAELTPQDLYWLVTTGGPTLIALLGGPIAGRGIERADTPPPPKEAPRGR